jgi:hypothetical protein
MWATQILRPCPSKNGAILRLHDGTLMTTTPQEGPVVLQVPPVGQVYQYTIGQTTGANPKGCTFTIDSDGVVTGS